MKIYKRKLADASKCKIFILTEGGKKTGYGHLVRCVALYDAFREKGVRPSLAICGDPSVRAVLDGRRYTAADWKAAGFIKKLAGADIVVVDSYLAPARVYGRISSVVKVLASLDDYNRFQYPSGVVINGAVEPGQLPYRNTQDVVYLVGHRYQPFRKEFCKVPAKRINANCRKILISVGANDPFDLIPEILRALNERCPELQKDVLVGKNFDRSRIPSNIIGPGTRFHIGPPPDNLKALMLGADIAISAGGQTLCELARVGVPSIAIIVAANQARNVDNLMRYGFVLSSVKPGRGRNFDEAILSAVRKLRDKDVRAKSSLAGRRLLDGAGAARVAEYLLERLAETESPPDPKEDR